MTQRYNLDSGQIDKQVFDDDKKVLRVAAFSNLVTENYDNILIGYVAAGPGTGEIGTVTFKLSSTTVAVLTLTYDGSNRLSTVTRI